MKLKEHFSIIKKKHIDRVELKVSQILSTMNQKLRKKVSEIKSEYGLNLEKISNLDLKFAQSILINRIKKYKESKNLSSENNSNVPLNYLFEAIVEDNALQIDSNILKESGIKDYFSKFCNDLLNNLDWEMEDFQLFEGEYIVFESLKNKGFQLIISSNSQNPQKKNKILNFFGLRNFFTKIIYSCSVSLRKPDSKIFEYIKNLFPEVKNFEFVIIGNSLVHDIL